MIGHRSEVGVDNLLVAQHLGWRPLRDDPTEFKYDKTAAQALQEVHLVLNHHKAA
jgi:hypothetical protein